ncbi:MAG: DUF5703 domain-containing protein [Planctomycetota bacterium]|jgi:hypothetical protein
MFNRQRTIFAAIIILSGIHPAAVPANVNEDNLESYNIVWDSPSKDHSGSMPIGNGDIGINVWVEENGDLVFYIGKTDSWGDNARLLKIGKIRIKMTPNPFGNSREFLQILKLKDATIYIQYGDEQHARKLKVWVDANHPVIHISADGKKDFSMTACIELWRTERYELPSLEYSDVHKDRRRSDQKHAATIVEPDRVLENLDSRIGWYHHNIKSVGPELTMQIQGLTGYEMADPLIDRTFGAVVTADGGRRIDDLTLKTTSARNHTINVYILTKHPAKTKEWIRAIEQIINTIQRTDIKSLRAAHEKWWADFWDRSWIYAMSNTPEKDSDQSETYVVTRGYILQRFINACGGRGAYPIKFNGTIFTVLSTLGTWILVAEHQTAVLQYVPFR